MTAEKGHDLLKQVAEVLLTYGVRSVNMDDIARHLKISKKTLYKHFKDKSDIVEKVTTLHCETEKYIIQELTIKSENAIDEMIIMSEFFNQMLKTINPSVHFDLEKYYPESFHRFNQHKNTFIKSVIEQNLVRGVKEGLYRDNLNASIIATLYVQRLDMVWDAEIFDVKETSFAEIHLEMIRYHVRGVASSKGIEYLKHRINKEQIKL